MIGKIVNGIMKNTGKVLRGIVNGIVNGIVSGIVSGMGRIIYNPIRKITSKLIQLNQAIKNILYFKISNIFITALNLLIAFNLFTAKSGIMQISHYNQKLARVQKLNKQLKTEHIALMNQIGYLSSKKANRDYVETLAINQFNMTPKGYKVIKISE